MNTSYPCAPSLFPSAKVQSPQPSWNATTAGIRSRTLRASASGASSPLVPCSALPPAMLKVPIWYWAGAACAGAVCAGAATSAGPSALAGTVTSAVASRASAPANASLIGLLSSCLLVGGGR